MSIYDHENYIPLKPGEKLWRYIDFNKFKLLLETKSLFFCRADKFSDPFEGSVPKKESEYKIKMHDYYALNFPDQFDPVQSLTNIKGIEPGI